MTKTKILFIGTSDFAVPILEKLAHSEFIELIGVVTQPDKSIGRHQSELGQSPVKQWVQTSSKKEKKVQLFQPEKLRDEAEKIIELTQPDLIIVASYGQMVPKIMIDYPKFKCLNVHVSLLPDLRGAVPMPMAILKGYKKTGVSIPIMTEKLDDGDIIARREFDIDDDETTESLTKKASNVGADLLISILQKWMNGEVKPVPQDHSKATYCTQNDISKEKAQLLTTDTAIDIDRKIRAFYPWPIAWSFLRGPEDDKQMEGIEANAQFKGKRLKIFKIKVLDEKYPNKKNLKLFKYENRLILRADDGWLEILECQLEGKKKMPGSDYLFLANDKCESAPII